MCKRRSTLILFFNILTIITEAQVADSSLIKELDNVVITATRSEGKLVILLFPHN